MKGYEKIKPVLTPIKITTKHGHTYRVISRYVAQCGNCGEPLDKWGDRYFCQFCKFTVDWSKCDKQTETRDRHIKKVVKL